jgi:hypothetical protein
LPNSPHAFGSVPFKQMSPEQHPLQFCGLHRLLTWQKPPPDGWGKHVSPSIAQLVH